MLRKGKGRGPVGGCGGKSYVRLHVESGARTLPGKGSREKTQYAAVGTPKSGESDWGWRKNGKVLSKEEEAMLHLLQHILSKKGVSVTWRS